MTDLIEAYAERLRAAGSPDTTIRTRCRVLRQADRAMPEGLEGACGDDIARFLAGRRAPWTRATSYSHLRGFYRTMVATGRMAFDPTDHVVRPKPGDNLPDPVEDHELAYTLSHSPPQPWYAAVTLAAYAGLRCCEIVNLDGADVTEESVFVRRGKGGKGRRVPTHPLIWQLVRGVSGLVVTSHTGLAMSPEYLSQQARHFFDHLAMPAVHMHRFRHWFGTTLCDRGVPIEVVKELMGHQSIATTQGYVRVSVARQRQAMLTLPTVEHEPAGNRLVPIGG